MTIALIKLKQGIGRLIRSMTDTGVIAILDSRVNTEGAYRKLVLEMLHDYPIAKTLSCIQRFLKRIKPLKYWECFFPTST